MLYWFFFLSMAGSVWFGGPLSQGPYAQRMTIQNRHPHITFSRPKLQSQTLTSGSTQTYEPLCCSPNPPPPPRGDDL
jgi:hypothetical protein